MRIWTVVLALTAAIGGCDGLEHAESDRRADRGDGVDRACEPSIWAKVGWWRAVPARLAIQGERFDGPAPPLRGSVPAGYGGIG